LCAQRQSIASDDLRDLVGASRQRLAIRFRAHHRRRAGRGDTRRHRDLPHLRDGPAERARLPRSVSQHLQLLCANEFGLFSTVSQKLRTAHAVCQSCSLQRALLLSHADQLQRVQRSMNNTKIVLVVVGVVTVECVVADVKRALRFMFNAIMVCSRTKTE
jgi:hypothetical protein